MCFTTVTAATVLVNVVYHGNESHGNGNCVFHCNVTTVITAVKSPREALNNILLIGSKGHAFVDKVLFDQDKCSRGHAFVDKVLFVQFWGMLSYADADSMFRKVG